MPRCPKCGQENPDHARFAEPLSQARAIFRRLGAGPLVAEVDALRR